jgi:hypothetical protein
MVFYVRNVILNMSEAGYDENWIDLDDQIVPFLDMPSDLRF